jgi:hypothetical protein
MSLANPLPRGVRQSPVYKADGVTTVFGVPFWFIDGADLQVSVMAPGGGQTATYTGLVGYAATGAGNPAGGAISFAAPPVAGALVWAQGLRVPNRTTSVVNGGNLISAALEAELDVETVTMQELRRDCSIALQAVQWLAAHSRASFGPARSACLLTLQSNVTGGVNWFSALAAAVPNNESDPFNIAWNDGLWPIGAPIWGYVQTTLNLALAGGFSAVQLAALQAQCAALQSLAGPQMMRRGQVWAGLALNATAGLNWLAAYQAGLSDNEADPANIADRDGLWPVGGYAFANLLWILNNALAGGFSAVQLAALQTQCAALP